jgi:AAA+ ATPase superfamily predicted ATPase
METQISYFALFGGLGWEVDTSKPIHELVQTLILDNFELLHNKLEEITHGEPEIKRLLRALAIGDRRIFSAFKRAGLNNGNGGGALKFLQEAGVIQMEYSREEHPREKNPNAKLKRREARHRISHKVLFTHPFVRFWFYFIAPETKNIMEGVYDSLFLKLDEHLNSYTSLVFEELSEVLLNYNLRESQIVSSGSYWDANIEIDILTITDDEKIYVGECKWKNHKINKKELHKLKEKCEKLSIEPNQLIFFSKRGFSKELLLMQGAQLALYSAQEFSALLKNCSQDTLIENFIN